MQSKSEAVTIIVTIAALAILLFAAGCGTIEGIGRDLESASQFMAAAFHQPEEVQP